MSNKLDPQNIEAEESTLGALLIDPAAITFVREMLSASDFYLERHGWIYESISELYDRKVPADLVTLSDELERQGRLDQAGGSAYLTRLINATPSSIHLKYYAEIVKRTSVLRQLIDASAKIAKVAYSDDDHCEQIIQKATDILRDVSAGNLSHMPRPVGKFTPAFMDHLDRVGKLNGIAGLRSGLYDLDRMLGGFQPSKFYLIAGRPGMGKSSLGLQLARQTAKAGKQGLFFTAEMPGDELLGRLVSAESQVDGQLIQHGPLKENHWPAILEATNYISGWPLLIDDRTRTVEGIRSRATLQTYSGLDLIIVDYIQLIQTGRKYDKRDSELGAISAELKSLALDLEVPVVAISSLNRQCEMRRDKRPMLADLRESGSLEYDADVVLFAYRDEVYHPNSEFPNLCELIVAKHRGGRLGTITSYFQKHLTTFIDLALKQESLSGINGSNGKHENVSVFAGPA